MTTNYERIKNMTIKDEKFEVLKHLICAKEELNKTINNRIEIEKLNKEQMLTLINKFDDFTISLRKYWM